MTLELYIYGCQTCGIDSVYVRRLKAYCYQNDINLVIKNTKYDQQALIEHGIHLSVLEATGDSYQPVVVSNSVVSLLREWQP